MAHSDTQAFNFLLSRHKGSLLEKLIKVDKYSCVLLKNELKINRNYNTRWFYQVMITIFHYYLILIPEIENKLKEIPEERVDSISDWEVITKEHLNQYKATRMTSSNFRDYYEETINYIELRNSLRKKVENGCKKE